LTDDKDVAETIARHRSQGKKFTILTCELRKLDPKSLFDQTTAKPGGIDNTWASKGFNVSKAYHPPWAGVKRTFPEYCVCPSFAKNIHITKTEVFAAKKATQPPPCYIMHRPSNKFLDSHGEGCWIWGSGDPKEKGDVPTNLLWQRVPVGGTKDVFYLVNVHHRMFMDEKIRLWGDGANTGKVPKNLQWRFEAVKGEKNCFYIVNVGTSQFLDSHGKAESGKTVEPVMLWGNGKDKGKVPKNIQWVVEEQ